MNGADFRLFYEKYGAYVLAEISGVPVTTIRHLSAENSMADYDLELDGIKYDVKTANPTNMRKFKVWDFSLRKMCHGKRVGQNRECDYFILIGMKNSMPCRTYIVPSSEAPTNHIRISVNGESKYGVYKVK